MCRVAAIQPVPRRLGRASHDQLPADVDNGDNKCRWCVVRNTQRIRCGCVGTGSDRNDEANEGEVFIMMLIAVDPHNMANQPDNVGDAAAQLVRVCRQPHTTHLRQPLVTQREFESRADASDPQASELLQQMRAYVSKVGGGCTRACRWVYPPPHRWKRLVPTRIRGCRSPRPNSKQRSACLLTNWRYVPALLVCVLAGRRHTVSGAQDNFGREADWVMVKEHPWSVPRLAKKPGNQ